MDSKAELETPRPYLSWSQLNLLERDPMRYVEHYMMGYEIVGNKPMELGKEVATALETGVPHTDPGIIFLQEFLPEFKHREYEIKDVMAGEVPILAKLDGFDDAELGIDEVKTGKLWTQAQVDKADQLTFYAMAVWLKYKKLPKRITLHWARTQYNEDTEEYEITAEITTFTTTRELADILKMVSRCNRAWQEIKRLYKQHKLQSNV